MAGVAAGAATLAIAATMALGCGAVAAASVHAARAAGAADAAALAAADAATGAVGGAPCERAADVAARTGAVIVSCGVDGVVATVRVKIGAGLLAAQARARAGPAP